MHSKILLQQDRKFSGDPFMQSKDRITTSTVEAMVVLRNRIDPESAALTLLIRRNTKCHISVPDRPNYYPIRIDATSISLCQSTH